MGAIPFAEVRQWMDAALVFWAARGVDRTHGGFLEELSPAGEATDVSLKRVRVICRQTYVFSHAALLGKAEYEPLSALGYEYLIARARTPDGGWARRLSRQGEITDATPDLYDIAFVLFALGWRYKLTKEAEVLQRAHDTLAFVKTCMKGPCGGYWHWTPPSGPRLQNPHMHLLEACLNLFEASGDERYWSEAQGLVRLFEERFFDGTTLAEEFREDWARASVPEQTSVEPGHLFEWAWILTQYRRLGGADFGEAADALVSFAERCGVDPRSGLVWDGLNALGQPTRKSSRMWTNTERIKGWLALTEVEKADGRPRVAQSCRVLFDRYLGVDPYGLWLDQIDENGAAASQIAPASTFYHVFLAFAEVLRLESVLAAKTGKHA